MGIINKIKERENNDQWAVITHHASPAPYFIYNKDAPGKPGRRVGVPQPNYKSTADIKPFSAINSLLIT